MGGLPDLLFVIDTNKEDIAIQEARRLGLGRLPSSTPTAIPTDHLRGSGNDDASRRAITL